MTNFKLETDADGIALVTWDMPGRSMNVLDAAVLAELSDIVDKTTADAAVKGVVITSGKDSFCAGADLNLLQTLNAQFAKAQKAKGEEAAAKEVFEESRKASLLYRRIETCGKPWVAAINGTAHGRRLRTRARLPLSRRRQQSENARRSARNQGRTVSRAPAARRACRACCRRRTRCNICSRAISSISNARSKMKLIDAVVAPDKLVQTGKDWIKGGGSAKKPWDMDGYRLPSGPVYSKAGMMTWPAANAIYRRETYDNYPAARAILQVVYEGLQLPMDLALRVESRWFAKIVRSPEAAAMMRSLFVSMQDLNKGARRPAAMPAGEDQARRHRRRRLHGRQHRLCHRAGRHRRRPDRPRSAERRQGQGAFGQVDRRAGRARPRQRSRRDALLARITATADYAALKDCDLVIEAVFEDRKVKAETIKKVQDIIGDNVVFGSNTSTLPITSLAQEFKDPRALHRHPFLLAGREDDAGRSHPRQEYRRRRARDRARLCARDPQDADRRQRFARLLHLARRRHLSSAKAI